eukprot:5581556-Pleurochrysis_carterae.AAC.1
MALNEGRNICILAKKHAKHLRNPEDRAALCRLPSYIMANGERVNMCKSDDIGGCTQNTISKQVHATQRDKHAYAFGATEAYTNNTSLTQRTGPSLYDIAGNDMRYPDERMIRAPSDTRRAFLDAVLEKNAARPSFKTLNKNEYNDRDRVSELLPGMREMSVSDHRRMNELRSNATSKSDAHGERL